MIVIIDYGAGNIGSIKNMLKKLGFASSISSDPNIIDKADKLILPGVGSFAFGINQIRNLDLIHTLERKVIHLKTPILGICLGAQLFTKSSEEGNESGLGWFNAYVKKFSVSTKGVRLRVPHMGWDEPKVLKNSRLFLGMENDMRFYFVHSYYIKSNAQSDVLTESCYGVTFASALEKENIIGVQFHPEKSHRFGMQLMRNFVEQY